jgi:hypothetical protein
MGATPPQLPDYPITQLPNPSIRLVRPEGVEPPAYRFEACRSIQLSYGRVKIECSARGRAWQDSRAARRLDCGPCVRIGFCLGAVFRDRYMPSPTGPVAQLAEQQTLNLRVVGSIPTRLTILAKRLSAFS